MDRLARLQAPAAALLALALVAAYAYGAPSLVTEALALALGALGVARPSERAQRAAQALTQGDGPVPVPTPVSADGADPDAITAVN